MRGEYDQIADTYELPPKGRYCRSVILVKGESELSGSESTTAMFSLSLPESRLSSIHMR